MVYMRLWENGERGWALKASSEALEFCLVLSVFPSGGQLTQVLSHQSLLLSMKVSCLCDKGRRPDPGLQGLWLWPLITIQPQFSAFLLSTLRLI